MKKFGEIALAAGGILGGLAIIFISIDILTDGAITRTIVPIEEKVTENE